MLNLSRESPRLNIGFRSKLDDERRLVLPSFHHAAWVLWFLGKPDQAMDLIEQALTLARELSEPHGLAHALFFAAMLHQLRREEQMAQECAKAVITISGEHGLIRWTCVTREP